MPRPRKKRRCRHFPGDRVFKPRSVPMPELEVVFLQEDELEALRLCDLEGLDQMTAGERMGISRGTVQRLLKSGRGTLVRALVDNSALVIGSARDLRGPARKEVAERAEAPEDEVARAGVLDDEVEWAGALEDDSTQRKERDT